ncbi:thiamine phosphate synthase [Anaerotignum sp.]
MSDILCVTNRNLCREDFLQRIEKIAENRPKGIILREKDLSEEEYKTLAEKVLNCCKKYDVPCILHSFVDAAMELGAENIHLPLHILREMDEKTKEAFKIIGASCHSVEEAQEAERLGCTYITAGHVFVTDCKKGLAPRGLEFLRKVCESVSVPVYAIGGISNANIDLVRKASAAGACVMSGLMRCEDVKETMKGFEIKA